MQVRVGRSAFGSSETHSPQVLHRGRVDAPWSKRRLGLHPRSSIQGPRSKLSSTPPRVRMRSFPAWVDRILVRRPDESLPGWEGNGLVSLPPRRVVAAPIPSPALPRAVVQDAFPPEPVEPKLPLETPPRPPLHPLQMKPGGWAIGDRSRLLLEPSSSRWRRLFLTRRQAFLSCRGRNEERGARGGRRRAEGSTGPCFPPARVESEPTMNLAYDGRSEHLSTPLVRSALATSHPRGVLARPARSRSVSHDPFR